MTPRKTYRDDAAALRKKAEEIARVEEGRDPAALSPEETRRLVHELRVYQIELEMQNEELRRAQVEIDAARARYFELYDLAPVGYLTVSENGLILEANLTAANLLGLERPALSKKPLTHFILHEDQDIYYHHRRRLFETGDRQMCELRMSRRDGSPFWALLEANVAEDAESGEPVCRIAAIDISEQKSAQESLRKNEEKFCGFFEDDLTGDYITSGNGVILDCNSAFLKIFGYQDKLEVINQNITETYPTPSERGLIFDQLRVEGKLERYETTRMRKDGELIIVDENIVATYDEDGKLTEVKGYVYDITKRKKAENNLRQSEEKFREYFNNGPNYCYIISSEGSILEVNPAAVKALGYSSKEELIGKPIVTTIYAPSSREKAGELFLKWKETGRLDSHELQIITRRGEERTVLLQAGTIKDPDGNVIHSVSFQTDITERKRAEEEREKFQEQLLQAQKMEAVGILSGGIAHDFNNLLQVIKGYTEILLFDKVEQDPEYPSLLALQNAGNRASNLVHRLLLFSRKASPKQKPIDINREIDKAHQILERTIPKMIEIEIRLGSRLWTINADPVQVEQILLNLGTNAADAMPDGGKLIIETENVTLADEHTRNQVGVQPGRYVLLAVSDSGQGMERETMEHMFDPFFTTKEIGKGTGLGLASVYGIVKSHGGYITCHSEVGRGTTFKIYLPAINEVDTDAADNTLETKPPQGGPETILLVDDEESIRDFASQVLKRFSYTILTASSGEEALEIYINKSNEIDLVIMDLGMPGMGGLKCLREIVQIVPSAKVLIASGYSMDGQIKKTLEAGAVGYVAKPYQVFDLLGKVREVLNENK